jgi:hypothetical protein
VSTIDAWPADSPYRHHSSSIEVSTKDALELMANYRTLRRAKVRRGTARMTLVHTWSASQRALARRVQEVLR